MILKTILVFKKTIWFVKVFGLFNKLQIFCFQKDLVPLITLQKCLKPCYLGGSGGKCQNWNWTWEYLWGSYSTFNLELKCYVQKWQGLIFVKKSLGVTDAPILGAFLPISLHPVIEIYLNFSYLTTLTLSNCFSAFLVCFHIMSLVMQ